MIIVEECGAPAMSNALAIGATAAEWVAERRNFEDWTPARQSELDAWLAEATAHRVAFVRIEATWRRTDRLVALRRPMRDSKNHEQKPRSYWIQGGVLTGFIAVAVSIIGGNVLTHPREQTFATSVGGREQITLADGTLIELNTDTTLRVGLDENARTITLDKGEAFFQVKHDVAHPFVVMAGAHRVTDLGTKFSVRRDPERLSVSLVEGRARFDTAAGEQHGSTLEMSPGDQIFATLTGVTLIKKPVAVLAKGLGWRHGVVVFNDTSLGDAAAEFNRYSHTKLVFADARLASLTIEGTFQTNNIEAFADVLQAALGLRAEVRDGAIVISAKK